MCRLNVSRQKRGRRQVRVKRRDGNRDLYNCIRMVPKSLLFAPCHSVPCYLDRIGCTRE